MKLIFRPFPWEPQVRDASVRHVVVSTDKFANLRGQAAAELVLFVHNFMRAGVKQFPT